MCLYTEFKGRRAPKISVTEIYYILMQYFKKSILMPKNPNIKILKEGHLLTCWPCKINITKPQVSLMPQMGKKYSQLSWPGGHKDQIRK